MNMDKRRKKNLSELDSQFKMYLIRNGVPTIQRIKEPQHFSFLTLQVMPTANPDWYNIDIAEIVPNQQNLTYVSSSSYLEQKNSRFVRSVCSIAKKMYSICNDFFANNTQYNLNRIEFSIAVNNRDFWVIYLKWPSIYTTVLSDRNTGEILCVEKIAELEYKKTDEYKLLEEQLKAAGAFGYWTGGK